MPTIVEARKKGMLPAKGERPELAIWNVKLDDERVAEMLRKLDSQPPTGEVTVQETEHGLKAKAVQSFQRNGSKSYEADPRGLRGRNASTAASYAKDLVIYGKIELDQLSLYAEKFYDFIESKAKVDG